MLVVLVLTLLVIPVSFVLIVVLPIAVIHLLFTILIIRTWFVRVCACACARGASCLLGASLVISFCSLYLGS